MSSRSTLTCVIYAGDAVSAAAAAGSAAAAGERSALHAAVGIASVSNLVQGPCYHQRELGMQHG